MGYSRRQQIASLYNQANGDTYIRNKREKGQKRFFICCCCGKNLDFEDSDDYVGAVKQWELFGDRCYACAKGYCHCKEKPNAEQEEVKR